MKALRYVWTKDARRMAPWLAGYYALLLLLVVLAKDPRAPQIVGPPEVGLGLGMVTMLVHLLLVWTLFSQDSPREPLGFWLTRPLSGWSILAGKEAFYLASLALPAMLAQSLALLCLGAAPKALPGLLLWAGIGFLPIFIIAPLIAAMTRTSSAYLLVLGFLVLLEAALTTSAISFAIQPGIEPGLAHADLAAVAARSLLSLGAALLLAHLYRTRRPLFSATVFSLLVLWMGIVSPFEAAPSKAWREPPSMAFKLSAYPQESTPTLEAGGRLREGHPPSPRTERLRTLLTASSRAERTYFRPLSYELVLHDDAGRKIPLDVIASPWIATLEAFSETLDPSGKLGRPALRKDGTKVQGYEDSPLELSLPRKTYARYTGSSMAVSGRVLLSERRLSVVGELPIESGAQLDLGLLHVELHTAQRLTHTLGLTFEERGLASRATRCELFLVFLNREWGEVAPVRTRGESVLRAQREIPLPLPQPAVFVIADLISIQNLPAGWTEGAELLVVRDCLVRDRVATVAAEDFRLRSHRIVPSPLAPDVDFHAEKGD